MSERVYYAIGDIHGENERLGRLHEFIFEDAARLGADFTLVHVGDLIDRGPDSRGVVARLMKLENEISSITLKGNHEELMLHAYDRDESAGLYHWATNGGDETIESYKTFHDAKDHWRDAIDSDHIAWLRQLPAIWRDEARGLVFVHAGIDPQTFPKCSDEIRLWTRSQKFFDPGRWPDRPEVAGIRVIHGHTPTSDYEPHLDPRRINIDTGVCYGGPLTCVVLAPGEEPRFLKA